MKNLTLKQLSLRKLLNRNPKGIKIFRSFSSILIMINVWIFLLFQPLFPQSPPKTLSTEEIRKTVEKIAAVFETKYVFPDVGNKIAELILKKMEMRDYDNLHQCSDLARTLQEDAQSINGDRHISIYYAPERIKAMKDHENQKKIQEETLLRTRMNNFGFKEVRILSGNIGYLMLNSFEGTKAAFDTAVAAMQFLANSDAVIIDLRWNPGGESAMVQFLCSYFLDESPKLLDVFHFRENSRIEQLWSLPYVPGQKLKKADLYILTSRLTFSASEGMAYDLQALKRAAVLGEVTMGGAHPVDTISIGENFLINMPYAFSRNPITQDNFEGKGVKPDIEIRSENALAKAHFLALEKKIEHEENETLKAALEWAKDGIITQSVDLKTKVKQSYAGSYGPSRILYEEGTLYFQFGPGKLRMIPITEVNFKIDHVDYFRVKMIIQNDSVIGIEVYYENGSKEKFSRNGLNSKIQE